MSEVQEPKQDGAQEPMNGQEKPRKPGTFRPGDARINRNGAPKKGVSEPDVPRLLRDLRHVYDCPKSSDKTQGQRMLRELFEKNPEKFVYRLQKAEAEFRAGKRPVKAEEPAEEERDEGSARSLALLDDLLANIAARQAQEDAELAKRPDAAQIAGTLQNHLKAALGREAALRAELDQLRGRG